MKTTKVAVDGDATVIHDENVAISFSSTNHSCETQTAFDRLTPRSIIKLFERVRDRSIAGTPVPREDYERGKTRAVLLIGRNHSVDSARHISSPCVIDVSVDIDGHHLAIYSATCKTQVELASSTTPLISVIVSRGQSTLLTSSTNSADKPKRHTYSESDYPLRIRIKHDAAHG